MIEVMYDKILGRIRESGNGGGGGGDYTPQVLTVNGMTTLTSEQAASLRPGDMVVTAYGQTYIVVSKDTSYLYLANFMNGPITEIKYRSLDGGDTWSYYSSKTYNMPIIGSTNDITALASPVVASLKPGDIITCTTATKQQTYVVSMKDDTDGRLSLVYCDVWTIETVNYVKTNNTWTYDQTVVCDVKTKVLSSQDSTLTQQMADNSIYTAGELTALTITLPSTIGADYISQMDFTSGATPTTLTAPVDILWSGDDLTNGVFVPVASMRYVVMLYSDGVSVRGVVQGFATT